MVDLKFAYPMTVSGMGMLASSILSYGACRWLNLVEAKTVITMDFWVRRMLPVGFFMGLSLWTGNLVYLHLTVAFIQMLKAFTPVITMVRAPVATSASMPHSSMRGRLRLGLSPVDLPPGCPACLNSLSLPCACVQWACGPLCACACAHRYARLPP